jgi:site-specific recombinase XerD
MTLENYLQQTLRETTVKIYLYEINKFIDQNPENKTYTYQKIMQYIELLRYEKQPQTVARIVASLKKYYQYLIEVKVRKDNPARAIILRDAKSNPIQLQDLCTPKELQRLLEPRQERYPFLAKRNQVIMSLLVHQGIRTNELTQLKTTDIDLVKAQIHITKTSQTNSRTLPLEASQILLLYEYINSYRTKLVTNRTQSNHLLLSKLGTPTTSDDIHYLLTTYPKAEFSNKTITTITIRQSVITNLLAQNNDLRKVQYFAGHKSLDTTEKYKETGLNALQTAIDKLHPIK